MIFFANDPDHFINIEISDEIAVEQVQALLDFVETELRPANNDFAAVIEISPQHLAEAHDLRSTLVQDIHVETESVLQITDPEQAFHQHIWLDGFCPRFQDEANVLGALVPDISKQWRFLGLDQVGQTLDQFRFLDLVGDFRHHNLPGAATKVFDRPFGAHAEAAPSGLVSLED